MSPPGHQDFDDWKRIRAGKNDRSTVPVPVPLGIVETTAAKMYARFGRWPDGYQAWSMKYCRGVIPSRVLALAEKLRKERPWEAEEDPHPGMTRISMGPHSFLVPTSEVFGAPARKES